MENQLPHKQIKWLYFLLALAVFLNFSGIFVTIIGPDGALYASIAKQMAVSNNFFDLISEGKDWLDKPHFPFWMTALSFKLYGINTWAYKLPAILFLMLGAYYTFKLADKLYNKRVALWSAIVLLTAQHIVISNTDVRAEPFLTGLIVASVYHYVCALERRWLKHLFLGSLFAAAAVMTKGVFALVPIAGAIGLPLVIFKNWSMLFNRRWLLAFLLIAIMILPELWSLYAQFDQHPEKFVFGKQAISGIKFFFWDSQFGRFFNTGPIKKAGGDPTFFLHTSLWAFLPWSILFYAGVVQFFNKKNLRSSSNGWICISAILLTLIVLSASSFQLPHYIIIIFPFFAIITGRYICTTRSEKHLTRIRIVQHTVCGLMLVATLVIYIHFRPDFNIVLSIILLILISILYYFNRTIISNFKPYFNTIVVAMMVNFFFNLAYYPKLTRYQADSEAAFWLNDNNPEQLPIVKVVNNYAYAINFYSQKHIHNYFLGEEHLLPKPPYLLYAETETIDRMEEEGIKMVHLKTFESYRITRVKLKFLNHKTRNQTLQSSQVVRVQ